MLGQRTSWPVLIYSWVQSRCRDGNNRSKLGRWRSNTPRRNGRCLGRGWLESGLTSVLAQACLPQIGPNVKHTLSSGRKKGRYLQREILGKHKTITRAQFFQRPPPACKYPL